jgi:2-polyprenyl-3-methyl-5-hydroxy-6-metoxy-1,4-benzoquinol methylase
MFRNRWFRSVPPAEAPFNKPKPPIIVSKPIGVAADDMDCFAFADGFEDPVQWERTIHQAFKDAEADEAFAEVLRSNFLEKDLADSFQRFQASRAPVAITRLLGRLGISLEAPIADVGCGRGHLAFAIHRLGHKNVTAMDPNSEWFTGTGYLKSRSDHNIKIVNSLDQWRDHRCFFDAVVSSGTVHHWQHIPCTTIDLRRVIKPGGYWLMISEYFANTPREFLSSINSHPTATRYRSYEWAYPASAYVDLVQTSGFLLVGVIPHTYNGNEFTTYSVPNDAGITKWVDENLTTPFGTVEAFWSEVDTLRRTSSSPGLYLYPQVLIFQRIEV